MVEEISGNNQNERILKSPRGQLTIRQPTPSVIVFVEVGFLEAGYVPYITNAQNALLATGARPHIFVDAAGLTGYDPEIQSSATQWIRANRKSVTMQHMLVHSRITMMGLSIASLVLGKVLKGYTSREEFELAIAKSVEETSPGADSEAGQAAV